MSATIIHIPRAIMTQNHWTPHQEPDNDEVMLEVADLMAQLCFGKDANDLTAEESDVVVATLTALWIGLNDIERES
jgi:hypothetical protein